MANSPADASQSPDDSSVVWLSREKFPAAYSEVIKALEEITNTRHELGKDEPLKTYEVFADQFYANVAAGFCKTVEDRWDLSLRVWASVFCASNCVKYSIRRDPVPSQIPIRDLLIENPAIFTALQFAQVQYLRMFSANKLIAPAMWPSQDIGTAIAKIKQYPAEAEDFVDLLNLHRFTIRGSGSG